MIENGSQQQRKGSLYVVGCGMRAGQFTLEAQQQIQKADKVFHLTATRETREWLKSLHGNIETLYQFYEPGKPRKQTYQEMVDRILYFVRQGWRVCAVFYGHPGVFVHASHEAVRIALAEGYQAAMQPGVSAEDSLFADLGVDPFTDGCQSFEATRFLKRKNVFDIHAMLILWQIGAIGIQDFQYPMTDRGGISVLVEYLLPFYGPAHEVTVYEASASEDIPPKILRIPLCQLNSSHVGCNSTLMIPPASQAEIDEEMRSKLAFA